ncbi:MAG: hypothetical protein ACUVRZ_09410 [Desulfobacca sp.]|uniref:hypothetical protein n=1 Tax=Desulfobacca sp. TaxID=2067990 RepID=UPI0040490644
MENRRAQLTPDPQTAAEASLMAKGLSVPAELVRSNRKILVISQEAGFSESVLTYATNLAERLGYDLIAVNVGPGAEGQGWLAAPYRTLRQAKFQWQARWAVRRARQRLAAKGLRFEHQVRFGTLSSVIEQLNHDRKRIEFVLNASTASEAEMLGGVTLPVFTIKAIQGDRTMAQQEARNWKLVGRTVGWGLATAALYAAVFLNSGTIMTYFTRGGLYAALPIVTVFAFSYVHGTFAHLVWEALGIRAPQQTVQPRPTAAKRPARRQRPRPRLRLNV